MAEFISEADLASYLQVTIPTGKAALVVKLANGLVTDVVGEVEVPTTKMIATALEVAARGWRNPGAYTSVTVGIDDYDKTTRREGKDVDKFGVYLTEDEEATLADEKALLAGQVLSRKRVGSVQLQVRDVP